MKELLTDPWFIGVGGGIISGLLVTLITRAVFSRRERREHRQKVTTANNELIYTLRPAVAEKRLPSREILDSLLSATAQKYGVAREDVYGPHALSNELVKEVMDNSFLSSEQKLEFCDFALKLRAEAEASNARKRVEIVEVSRDRPEPSILLGMTTAMMGVLIAFYMWMRERDGSSVLSSARNPRDYLPFFLIIILIPVLASFLSIFLREFRPRIERRSSDKRRKTPPTESVHESSAPDEPTASDTPKIEP